MCNTEQLVSYVYEELSASERVEFESHLSDCAECRKGLAELRGTRHLLASWAPPQPEFNFHIVRGAAPAAAPPKRFAFVPQWALSAAAALLLAAGVAAVANLEVRYGADGLVVRTGWMHVPAEAGSPAEAPAAGIAAQAAPVSASSDQLQRDVEALTARLRDLEEAQAAQVTRAAAPSRAPITAPELRRILAELESKQRTEVALQVSQVWKDFNAARVTDFSRLQDVVSRAQGVTNQQLRQHRDSIESLYRTASQR
jgi:anti-sigma factor RsiW